MPLRAMDSINSMLNIFVNSEKMLWRPIIDDSAALLCRWGFQPESDEWCSSYCIFVEQRQI